MSKAGHKLAGREQAVLVVIFLLSAVGLAYEVLLTRLFSVIFQYHYVFLIVSVSIAGLSAGAGLAVLTTRRRTVNWPGLTYTALALSILVVGVGVFFALLRSAGSMVAPLVAALLPFVGIGYINACLFALFARHSGTLYAADLFGGAAGLVLALLVIGVLGAFDAIIALSVLCGLAAFALAWITCQRTLRLSALGLTALLAVGLLVNRTTGLIQFSPAALTDAPPDKTMIAMLQEPQSVITATRWNPFARVDVVKTADDSLRYLFTDSGAGSIMYRFDGDLNKVDWLRQDIEYLPFMLSPETTKQVLILGAGAGRDVLMARLAGVPNITAVEINSSLVDLTRESADFNGHIFDLPGVQTVVADGRNFIERSATKYDLIYANIVYSQAAAPHNSALAESYIFTREALRVYWDHLADRGRIGFVTHQGIEGLRLLVGALDMLELTGLTLPQALDHVALLSIQGGDAQTRTSVVLITKGTWTLDTASEFAATAHQMGAGALYLPRFMDMGLDAMLDGTISLEEYIQSNREFNYTPTTDDRPFFFQFEPGLPAGIVDLIVIALIVAFGYLSWLIFFYVKRGHQHWKRISLGVYFALLGVAFLLIENPLIQRFGLLLGQPTLALIAVVGALLVGGGIGSLLSNRLTLPALTSVPRRVLVLGLVAGFAMLLSLIVYPYLIRASLRLDLPLRFVITVVAILPLGILMGTFFPTGLRIADKADPGGLAAFWGANAATSVLGSALAMTLAITSGFSSVFVLGAALYILVGLLAYLVWPKLLAS